MLVFTFIPNDSRPEPNAETTFDASLPQVSLQRRSSPAKAKTCGQVFGLRVSSAGFGILGSGSRVFYGVESGFQVKAFGMGDLGYSGLGWGLDV